MTDHSAKKYDEKQEAKEKKHEQGRMAEKKIIDEKIIRILSTDIPGKRKIFVGLTRIKGVSWSFANAICSSLNIDKTRTIESLSREEIDRISEFIKNPKVPNFLLNRRNDFETGKNVHLTGNDLDLQKELDIKRLKKIRSYRGLRHATGQPTRGQRTKSHFRTMGKKKAVGVQSKPKPEKGK